MKHINTSILLILILMICSCNSKVKPNSDAENKIEEPVLLSKTSKTKPVKEVKFRDTIAINYQEHKTLLNVLKILPKTTMQSWDWSKEDREKTVSFIEKNNYWIDSTEHFKNIKYIKPNTFGFQVVDGFWTLSLYEFNPNHIFVVTNDIVGDGNNIETYNYINNELRPLKMINYFEGFDTKLLTNYTPKCMALLEDHQLGYNYDFTNKNRIEISSLSLTKEGSQNCLKGNAITYKVNKENKIFDIEVYWKKDKPEVAKTLKTFKIIGETEGDLDKDGIPEKVIVYEAEEEIERQLFIYKKDNKKWKLWQKYNGGILPIEGGGMMGDPFEGISIERGCIVINHFGGSRQKWTYTHKFRYQNDVFQLIGATVNFGSPCDYVFNFDYNLSNGKVNYEKEIENCENYNSTIEKKEAIRKLETLPTLNNFSPGGNEFKFPNSEITVYY